MGPGDLLLLAVLGFVGFRLFDVARASLLARAHVLGLLAGMRARHFLLALPALAAVIAAASALYQVPALRFGWWSALGGQGNPVFGVTSPGASEELPILAAIPVLFVALLLLGLPLLVEGEELVFRRGAESRTRWGNVKRAVFFGLVHAVIGVPLAAALALSVGGLYLTAMYLREWRRSASQERAVAESTRAHLAYNLVIVLLVGVGLLFGI